MKQLRRSKEISEPEYQSKLQELVQNRQKSLYEKKPSAVIHRREAPGDTRHKPVNAVNVAQLSKEGQVGPLLDATLTPALTPQGARGAASTPTVNLGMA